MKLFGCMAAVGVHFDDDRVVALEAPGETGQVGLAQSVLHGPMHHMDPTGGVLGRQSIGHVAGTVRAGVVDHQDVNRGLGGEQPFDDDGEVLALVERRYDDKCAFPVRADKADSGGLLTIVLLLRDRSLRPVNISRLVRRPIANKMRRPSPGSPHVEARRPGGLPASPRNAFRDSPEGCRE